jgi:serine/threonine protein phosphatase PrpC
VIASVALQARSATDIEQIALGSGHAAMVSIRCPDGNGPNEDTAAVVSIGRNRALLVVADGLGGRPEGETASRIAVEALEEYAGAVRDGSRPLRTAILEAVDEANERIRKLGVGAGTTLAVVEIGDSAIRGYHVGDSEILAFGRGGRIKYQTVSHSPTSYAVESGLLDAVDALHHEDRHLVSNVLGDAAMRIEIGSWVRLASRDTVVVGTDGLFDNLSPEEITACARSGDLCAAARRLAEECLSRMLAPRPGLPSKPDDLTFVVYRRHAAQASRRLERTTLRAAGSRNTQ